MVLQRLRTFDKNLFVLDILDTCIWMHLVRHMQYQEDWETDQSNIIRLLTAPVSEVAGSNIQIH